MTAFQNNLRQIKPLLYRLKRLFGKRITLNRPTAYATNLETGVSSRTYQVVPVRRAIVLPAQEIRKFAYDLAFIAANKNFTYGGFFDESSAIAIIDSKDLPNAFTPNLDDHLIIDSRRWNIGEAVASEGNYGYILRLKQVSSTPDYVAPVPEPEPEPEPETP